MGACTPGLSPFQIHNDPRSRNRIWIAPIKTHAVHGMRVSPGPRTRAAQIDGLVAVIQDQLTSWIPRLSSPPSEHFMFSILTTLVLLCSAPSAGTQDSDQSAQQTLDPDPVAVAVLLEERCARCHGLNSENEKAIKEWPDATDLTATLLIDLMVKPGEPEESDLFITCDEGDMPPEDEVEEPLNASELALLARWISAGASLPNPTTLERRRAELKAARDGAEPPDETALMPHFGAKTWLAFSGRLHMTLLHFPVALLVLAGLLSLRPSPPDLLLKTCLAAAAPFACLASISGWILASEISGDMDLHRWLGVACAALSLGALLATLKAWRIWRPLVLLTCLILIAAAHGGGDLVHGEDWLRLPL
jgi:hypothetical protein